MAVCGRTPSDDLTKCDNRFCVFFFVNSKFPLEQSPPPPFGLYLTRSLSLPLVRHDKRKNFATSAARHVVCLPGLLCIIKWNWQIYFLGRHKIYCCFSHVSVVAVAAVAAAADALLCFSTVNRPNVRRQLEFFVTIYLMRRTHDTTAAAASELRILFVRNATMCLSSTLV